MGPQETWCGRLLFEWGPHECGADDLLSEWGPHKTGAQRSEHGLVGKRGNLPEGGVGPECPEGHTKLDGRIDPCAVATALFCRG